MLKFIIPSFSTVSDPKFLSKNQNDFRRYHSTSTWNILTISRMIESKRTKNLKATKLFVDFPNFLVLYSEERWSKFSIKKLLLLLWYITKIRKKLFTHLMKVLTSSILSLESCMEIHYYCICFYCPDSVLRTSLDLIKENGFTFLKKGKK